MTGWNATREAAPVSSGYHARVASGTPLFQSFFMAGFECSAHRRHDGRRLDLLASTRHDTLAYADYQAVRRHGLLTVRDGLRWHLIESSPRSYDWSSFLAQLHAAQCTGTQVIWDLLHYGWPDHLDIWSAAFVDHFASFCAAVAARVRDESDDVPFYCPVNEISFLAWAGGEEGCFKPYALSRGMELKQQLVRATIAGMDAIRSADPRVRFVATDPVINVIASTEADRTLAAAKTRSQYEAWDMLCGRLMPELGGSEDDLDIIGVNYYPHNQWFLDGDALRIDDPLYRPFHDILTEVHERYRRPFFIAETGAEGVRRVPWMNYIGDEALAALEDGVPLEGLCIYPITAYPGWDDDRHCPTGLLSSADTLGARAVNRELAFALAQQQERVRRVLARRETVHVAQ